MQRVTEAGAAILEAHEGLLDTLGGDYRRTTGAWEALTDLYDTWIATEADATPAEWGAKLRGEAPSDDGLDDSND